MKKIVQHQRESGSKKKSKETEIQCGLSMKAPLKIFMGFADVSLDGGH